VQRLNTVPVFQGRRFAALEMQRVSPDELPETPPSAAVAAAGQGVGDEQKLPRQTPFVEFLLRTEGAS
jgi:hypothetical protein